MMNRWIRTLQDRKHKKGFTLMEVIIAVVIVGILAAVAATAIPNMIESSKKRALATNLATMQNAVDRFYAEKGSWPTTGGTAGQIDPSPTGALIAQGYMKQIPSDKATFNLATGVVYGVTGGGTVYALDAATWAAPAATTKVYTAYDTSGNLTFASLK